MPSEVSASPSSAPSGDWMKKPSGASAVTTLSSRLTI